MMMSMKLCGRASQLLVVSGVFNTTPKCDDPCRLESSSSSTVPSRCILRGFPSFLPKEVEKIKDPFARRLSRRIERVHVENKSSDSFIMSRCVRPLVRNFWKSHIRRPMVWLFTSLGAAAVIDFTINHSEAVAKLVLINASVYTEGLENMATLPEALAYAGVSLLKSFPLLLYANMMAFHEISFSTRYDWTNVEQLHCLLPWWKESMVSMMTSGRYNVVDQIKAVKHEVLIIYAEHDKIIPKKLQVRLHCELLKAIIHQVPDCDHLLHVENPGAVTELIAEFASCNRVL